MESEEQQDWPAAQPGVRIEVRTNDDQQRYWVANWVGSGDMLEAVASGIDELLDRDGWTVVASGEPKPFPRPF